MKTNSTFNKLLFKKHPEYSDYVLHMTQAAHSGYYGVKAPTPPSQREQLPPIPQQKSAHVQLPQY